MNHLRHHYLGGWLCFIAFLLHLAPELGLARSWQHDAAGNRARDTFGTTSKLAWHNNRNQVTQIGGGGLSLVEGTLGELGTVTVKGQRRRASTRAHDALSWTVHQAAMDSRR